MLIEMVPSPRRWHGKPLVTVGDRPGYVVKLPITRSASVRQGLVVVRLGLPVEVSVKRVVSAIRHGLFLLVRNSGNEHVHVVQDDVYYQTRSN